MFLEQNMYSGVAPVPLDQYLRYMASIPGVSTGGVSRQQVREAFSHLVLSERVLDQLGPAINAGHSLFVYGPPGNGKSVISQAIRNLLLGEIYIPHALEVNGNLIQIYDPVNHEPQTPPSSGSGIEAMEVPDRRWVRCRRPLVTVGGELTLDALDLTYNPSAGFYRALSDLGAECWSSTTSAANVARLTPC
jgi:predicted ATPase with chaperone activity